MAVALPNTHTQIALEHFLHDTFIICTRVNVHVTLYNCKIKYLQILDQHYEKALLITVPKPTTNFYPRERDGTCT